MGTVTLSVVSIPVTVFDSVGVALDTLVVTSVSDEVVSDWDEVDDEIFDDSTVGTLVAVSSSCRVVSDWGGINSEIFDDSSVDTEVTCSSIMEGVVGVVVSSVDKKVREEVVCWSVNENENVVGSWVEKEVGGSPVDEEKVSSSVGKKVAGSSLGEEVVGSSVDEEVFGS